MPRKKSVNFDEARSKRLKQYYIDHPDHRKRITDHNKAFGNDPEERKKRSERMREVWEREDRKKIGMAEGMGMSGKHHTDKSKERIRAANLGKHNEPKSEETKDKMRSAWTPERRARIIETRKTYWDNLSDGGRNALIKGMHAGNSGKGKPRKKYNEWAEGRKKKFDEHVRGRKVPEEQKEKQRQRMLGKNNPNYQDGRSLGPYCPKFNKPFKLKVFAKQGKICIIPGCDKTGDNNIIIHHVFTEKMACCETKIEEMESLRKRLPPWIAQFNNPVFSEDEIGYIRMVVPICRSHHGRLNTKKERDAPYNESVYRKLFIEIIMDRYDGHCF